MKRLILTGSLALAMTLGLSSFAEAQNLRYTYAVKFVCGFADGDSSDFQPVAPGVYYTAANVYNPSKRDAFVDADVYFTFPSAGGGSDNGDSRNRLDAKTAVAFDCEDLFDEFDQNNGSNGDGFEEFFIEGVVYIWSTKPLDIMAVYTTEADSSSSSAPSVHVEHIKGRKFNRRGDAGKPVY